MLGPFSSIKGTACISWIQKLTGHFPESVPKKSPKNRRRNCLKRNQQINSPKSFFLPNFHLNRSSGRSRPHLTNFSSLKIPWASLGYAAICPERGSIEIHTTQLSTGTNDTSGLETPLDPSWSVGDKPQGHGLFWQPWSIKHEYVSPISTNSIDFPRLKFLYPLVFLALLAHKNDKLQLGERLRGRQRFSRV